MKAAVIKQFLADVAWGDLDFLVLDSPPGAAAVMREIVRPILELATDEELTPAKSSMAAEHGLSLWIEGSERPVLFDTGQGKALATNARRLGIDLGRAGTIVISHGHYDHTGGLPDVLGLATGARVVLHRDALTDRYSIDPARGPRQVGMPPGARGALESLPPERIARTLAALESAAPELIVPCHCTGDRAAAGIKRALGERVLLGHAGVILRFEGQHGVSIHENDQDAE